MRDDTYMLISAMRGFQIYVHVQHFLQGCKVKVEVFKTETIPNTFVTQLKIVTVVQGSVWYGVLWRSHELQRFPGKSRAL